MNVLGLCENVSLYPRETETKNFLGFARVAGNKPVVVVPAQSMKIVAVTGNRDSLGEPVVIEPLRNNAPHISWSCTVDKYCRSFS